MSSPQFSRKKATRSGDPVVELPVFFGLGALAGLLSYTFRGCIDFSTKFYKGEIQGLEGMAKLPKAGRPLVGALLTGIVAAQFPQVPNSGPQVD